MEIDIVRTELTYEFEEDFQLKKQFEEYDINEVSEGFYSIKLESDDEYLYISDDIELDVKDIKQAIGYNEKIEEFINTNKYSSLLKSFSIKIEVIYRDDKISLDCYKLDKSLDNLEVCYEGKNIYAIFKDIAIIINIDPAFRLKNSTSVCISLRVNNTINIIKLLEELEVLINSSIKSLIEDIIIGGEINGSIME